MLHFSWHSYIPASLSLSLISDSSFSYLTPTLILNQATLLGDTHLPLCSLQKNHTYTCEFWLNVLYVMCIQACLLELLWFLPQEFYYLYLCTVLEIDFSPHWWFWAPSTVIQNSLQLVSHSHSFFTSSRDRHFYSIPIYAGPIQCHSLGNRVPWVSSVISLIQELGG